MTRSTAIYLYTALLAVLYTTTARADSLLDLYPHEESVTLSNGHELQLPLQIQDATGVVLAGLADLEELREYLQPHGLEPLPLTPTQGLIALYNMNYERTDIGPYEELVVCVAATRDPNPRVPVLSTINDYAGLFAVYVPFLRGLVGDRTQDVLFTWKLYVTEDLPLRAGREVWGFPKSLANISVDVGSRAASFVVQENGELVMRGGYKRLLPWSVAMDVDAYLATPVDVLPKITHGISTNKSRFGLFMPWDDFQLNTDHPWGAALDAVGFQPVLWHTMSEIESVFLAPAAR